MILFISGILPKFALNAPNQKGKNMHSIHIIIRADSESESWLLRRKLRLSWIPIEGMSLYLRVSDSTVAVKVQRTEWSETNDIFFVNSSLQIRIRDFLNYFREDSNWEVTKMSSDLELDSFVIQGS